MLSSSPKSQSYTGSSPAKLPARPEKASVVWWGETGLREIPILIISQLKRLWYLSHRRPAKAQASLHIRSLRYSLT